MINVSVEANKILRERVSWSHSKEDRMYWLFKIKDKSNTCFCLCLFGGKSDKIHFLYFTK